MWVCGDFLRIYVFRTHAGRAQGGGGRKRGPKDLGTRHDENKMEPTADAARRAIGGPCAWPATLPPAPPSQRCAWPAATAGRCCPAQGGAARARESRVCCVRERRGALGGGGHRSALLPPPPPITHSLPVALLLLVALKVVLYPGLLAADGVLGVVRQHAHGGDHQARHAKGGEDVKGADAEAVLARLAGSERGGGGGRWGGGAREGERAAGRGKWPSRLAARVGLPARQEPRKLKNTRTMVAASSGEESGLQCSSQWPRSGTRRAAKQVAKKSTQCFFFSCDGAGGAAAAAGPGGRGPRPREELT